VTEEARPLRDFSDPTSTTTEGRGDISMVEESEAVRAAPPPAKAGPTPRPPEKVKKVKPAAIKEEARRSGVPDASGGRDVGSTIVVMMRVEQGLVVWAHIPQSRPGMEAYEAAALRIARNRRYPTNRKGTETLTIKINTRN